VALIENPENRYWRVSTRPNEGNLIFALIHNDPSRPSRDDVLIGNMDSAELAEYLVDVHNRVLRKFGRHYKIGLSVDS
jgi:hypothetical protein